MTVTEAGGAGRTQAYTVVLTAAPMDTVTITVASSDMNAAQVHGLGGTASASAILPFSTINYSTAQTVTAVDDTTDNNRITTITPSVTVCPMVFLYGLDRGGSGRAHRRSIDGRRS